MKNIAKQDLPAYRRLRLMHDSRYLTFPREWDLPAYEEYLVQREPSGRIILEPIRTPAQEPAS